MLIGGQAAFAQSPAAFTGWDFEDGTLQGWTVVSAPTLFGPTGYEATSRTFFSNETGVNFWDPLGYISKNAGYAAAATPFDDRALPHDAPLVLRSPTFALQESGQIIAHLLGGTIQPDALASPPSNYSDLSGESIDTNSPEGFDTAYLGIALRRDSDGAYLLHKGRNGNSSSGTGWGQATFTEEELAPIFADNPGELFTLDLIDTAHGTFGNINLDTVSVPVPVGPTLMGSGGEWQVLKRDSASITNFATANAVLALPDGDPQILGQFQGNYSVIDINGSPQNGHFNINDPLLGGSANNFVMKATGQIEVLEAGDITFGFNANDGASLRINGVVVAEDSVNGDNGVDTLGTINLTAGLHDVEFVMWETTGAESYELYVATTLGTYTDLSQANWELLTAVGGTAVPGDFNGDGNVDGADFVIWQTNFPNNSGSASLDQGDANGDGNVDGADFVVWQTNFPTTSSVTPVPEPTSMVLAAMAVGLGLAYRLPRRKA